MNRIWARNTWLLALCAILNAALALLTFEMFRQGPLTPPGVIAAMCGLAVAAGACSLAAGLWDSCRRQAWPLALNGVALGAYGLLPIIWTGPLSYRIFALLIVVMAASLAVLELTAAMRLEPRGANRWFLRLCGAASAGFAVAFLALTLRWLSTAPALHSPIFLWLGAYFGLSAFCMLALAFRSPGPNAAIVRLAGGPLAAS